MGGFSYHFLSCRWIYVESNQAQLAVADFVGSSVPWHSPGPPEHL